MDFFTDEPKAISSKCLSLIARTKSILNQLDQWDFPTPYTKNAVSLLLNVLEWLEKPSNLESIDPAVLYNRLFAMQNLIELVSDSSSDRISWPLVSYCDDIWQKLFGDDGPKIFYSLTSEHNYLMSLFSTRLARDLNGLMPNSEIKRLTDNNKIYCLQLASAEDANLQLYANIGHEFGHAIFDNRKDELLKSLNSHFVNVLKDIHSLLVSKDPLQADRRLIRISYIVMSIAKELFSDLVGVRLMGPSFLLSLYELSWGQDKSIWNIALSPVNYQIRAYPSFYFRLNCLFRFGNIDTFCANAKKDFVTAKCSLADVLPDCLRTVPRDHASDKLVVWPLDELDKSIIESVLTSHFSALKEAFERYLQEADILITSWYPLVIISQLDTMEIAQLLLRLQYDIPPNIIPDSSLLGRPANFQAILNASALRRIHLLVNKEKLSAEALAQRMGKIERLTAKSFEATYIQQKFNEWEKNSRSGNPE